MRDATDVQSQDILDQLEAKGVTRAQVASTLGISQPNATRLWLPDARTGKRRSLGFDEGRRLIQVFGLDAAEGSTPPPPAPPASIDDIAAEQGFVFLEELDLALGMGASFLDGNPEVVARVPFQESWLRGLFEGSFSHLKVVRARGDSMQPTMLDGDIVIVDTGHRRVDDQDRIWAVAYGELGMIRRIRVTHRGTWMLMPDNQVVRPDEVTDGEAVVIGRVVWIGRRM